MKQIRFLKLLTLLLPFLLSCDNNNSNPVTAPHVNALPTTFRLTGDAFVKDGDGRTATCSLDLIFEMRKETLRNAEQVDYDAIHGGEVFRTVEKKNGSGFAFHADVGGLVEAHLFLPVSYVNLHIPVNETAKGRFWQNMTDFKGVIDENGRASGSWTCAPLDLDNGVNNYTDTSLIATGTWRTEPIQ